MLNSLYIRNFRNLDELMINSLGRVNLITGKNNTGKSSLLEAVALWAKKGQMSLILEIIKRRGDYYKLSGNETDCTDKNVKSLSSLFSNRHVSFYSDDAIRIGETLADSLSIRFAIQTRENERIENGEKWSNIIFHKNPDKIPESVVRYTGFVTNYENGEYNYRRSFKLRSRIHIDERELKLPELQFVSSQDFNKNSNGSLFDQIILTEKEQDVVNALKIIEPNIERIAFVQENGRRKPVIKLSNNSEVAPLQSMGDGINRILTIILALVNCEDGYLLIDEFENGLHHSVQEQLWKIIFHLAEKLNIQVFATTHSRDCIESFENVLNSPKNVLDGKLIRLENKKGNIKAVEIRKEALKSATDYGIEIR